MTIAAWLGSHRFRERFTSNSDTDFGATPRAKFGGGLRDDVCVLNVREIDDGDDAATE